MKKNNLWIYENQTPNTRIGFKIKKILYSGKSKFQKIKVVESYEWGRILFLDGCVMLTERDEFLYHEMLVNPAMHIHSRPEKILIIGGGDGGTLGEVLKYDSVKQADLVEIDEKVIDISKKYFKKLTKSFLDKRSNVVIQDGFEFLKDKTNFYDVILVDSTDPKGMASCLISKKFYSLCKAALKKNGVLAMQTESPFIYKQYVGKIYPNLEKTFKKIYPYISFIPSYPSGMWSFCIASQVYNPINKKIKLKVQTKYFNEDIFKAIFYFARGLASSFKLTRAYK